MAVLLRFLQTFVTFLIRLIFALLWSIVDLFTPARRKQVQGKVVVVTGAAGGIGRELARIFTIKLGAKVVLLDKNETANEELAGELNDDGGIAFAFVADVTDSAQLKRVADKIYDNPDLGPPDIVICNAGVLFSKSLLELTDNDLKQTFDINVIGYFNTIRTFLPVMMNRNSGHLAAVSSIAGHFGSSLSSDYSASKFAVRGLMESLVWELVDANKTGVKVTTVYPYFTQTPMLNCCKPESRFFGLLKPKETALGIVDAILAEKEEVFVPSFFAPLASMIKGICPMRVRPVLRDLFDIRYKSQADIVAALIPRQETQNGVKRVAAKKTAAKNKN